MNIYEKLKEITLQNHNLTPLILISSKLLVIAYYGGIMVFFMWNCLKFDSKRSVVKDFLLSQPIWAYNLMSVILRIEQYQ